MKRYYESIVTHHLNHYRQMAFLAGPRQVGKTTLAKHLLEKNRGVYLNWDIADDREIILQGPKAIMQRHSPAQLGAMKSLTVLDEIHKYKDWKNYLKGFYDEFGQTTQIIVTGSSRLDIFVKGGDSLMGRYFPYTIHPLTVSELLQNANQPTALQGSSSSSEHPKHSTHLISEPRELSDEQWRQLFQYGGFPDPFLQNDVAFFNRWQNLRHQQLFKEDIVDLSKVSDIAQLEVLASVLLKQTGQLTNYTSLGRLARTTDQTIRRWLELLESVYFCFRIKPWYTNVTRSLRKEPKIYVWDWSLIKEDMGAKTENFIACHLRKSIDIWTQSGLGQIGLFYVRDKDKNEVDFLVTRDEKPWFLVEVKASSKQPLSSSLMFFQKQTGAEHAFQVAYDAPFVEEDCFHHHGPIVVPAKTLLSQLG